MNNYDLVVVGTGFSSCFFLHEYLKHADFNAKVLVLEKGEKKSHAWQRANITHSELDYKDTFINDSSNFKTWQFSMGFGGSSKCWSGCVPRMLPNDFKTLTTYGVGRDWPFSYDDLERFYTEVEHIMQVSGPTDYSLSYRSAGFPLPPHNFNEPDKLLKKHYPNLYYQQATARPSVPLPGRAPCCASNACHLCPMDAKFTVLNSFNNIYNDKRVELVTGAEVTKVNLNKSFVDSIQFKNRTGSLSKVGAGRFVLGANALFNAYILMKSGLKHPYLGKFLNEQVSKTAYIDLDGIDNFTGSTLITGQGYMFYDGDHRKDAAGCLIEHFNRPNFRKEIGRWRQRMEMKFIFEDIPSIHNFVDSAFDKPRVVYTDYSEYTKLGMSRIPDMIEQMSSALPIQRYLVNKEINPTEAHIQGTVRMAETIDEGVVDKFGVSFQYPNLVVLGSSAFPTCPAANPTITLSAHALMSANHLYS